MSDHGTPHVQLTAKQMVFLFMAGVVVLIGAFLLGESFGRAVRPEAPVAAAAGEDGTAVELPPPTDVKPSDLSYPETLQGNTRPASPPPAQAAATPPPATPPPVPAPAQTPARSPASGPSLQTDAFSTREAAEKALAKLQSERFTASISEAPAGTGGARFRVLVGPFASDAELQQMRTRLEKAGYRPFVRR